MTRLLLLSTVLRLPQPVEGGESIQQQLSHIYAEAGTYSLTLHARTGECKARSAVTLNVQTNNLQGSTVDPEEE